MCKGKCVGFGRIVKSESILERYEKERIVMKFTQPLAFCSDEPLVTGNSQIPHTLLRGLEKYVYLLFVVKGGEPFT